MNTLPIDNIRDFTLERSPISAMNMDEPSAREHTSRDTTRESTQEKRHEYND